MVAVVHQDTTLAIAGSLKVQKWPKYCAFLAILLITVLAGCSENSSELPAATLAASPTAVAVFAEQEGAGTCC